MSVEQVETAIRQLPPEDRRRLLIWLNDHRHELFMDEQVSAEQRAELLARQNEYVTRRHEFIRVATETELESLFQGIRSEVQARVSPAGAS
jgi:hypothetical protein